MPTIIGDHLTDSQKLLVISNAVLEQQAKLDRHHKVLIEGNGERPLVERVRNIETFIESFRFWQRTIAVAIVVQTLTIGVGAVVYIVRLYPLLERIANQP